MCELLGVSVRPAGRLGVLFNQFRPRAESNREGWGYSWWDDGRPRIVKEGTRADESEVAAGLAADPPTSDMFVVHVRAATVGEPRPENAHPFTHAARGRPWVFAHNGTVRELGRLDPGERRAEGDTDSERAFHHLLGRLDRLGLEASDAAVAEEVLLGGRELSEHDSKVNFLLTDGRSLFAYHDGHKTLHVLERSGSDLGAIDMADDDYEVSLRVGDASDERAVVVASVPLTDEPGWRRLEAGQFLVIRAGRVLADVAPGAVPALG